MSRLRQFVAVTLLALFLGVHWVALQSMGWATMLVTRSQTAGLGEAVRTTFDGEHPCEVCRMVSEGRKAEKQAPAVFKVTKIEAAMDACPAVLPPAPPMERVAIGVDLPRTSFRGSPPVPPPRFV